MEMHLTTLAGWSIMPLTRNQKNRRAIALLERVQEAQGIAAPHRHPLDVKSSWPENPGEYKNGHALDTRAKRCWREGNLNLEAPFYRSNRWYWIRRECGCGVVFTLRINAASVAIKTKCNKYRREQK